MDRLIFQPVIQEVSRRPLQSLIVELEKMFILQTLLLFVLLIIHANLLLLSVLLALAGLFLIGPQ